MSDVVVGIDLGTTNSVAALLDGDKARFIENALGDSLTPSVVALDKKSKSLLVGRPARELLSMNPELAAAAFKRSMGSDDVFELGKRKLGAVELSAHILSSLKQDTERSLGHPVERCVVTVPAYFGEPQRQATHRAATLAGFAVERILNEPTAAAIAYGLEKREDESLFMVFDLGGGTFDVCVMELFEGLLEVKGVAGESRLGGEDFTQALVDLVLTMAGVDTGEARGHAKDYAILWRRCELLKRKLSRWTEADVELPAFGGDLGRSFMVSRAMSDEAFRPLLQRMGAACRSALRAAKVSPRELDEVVLVGGATRMPCVREFVRNILGKEPLCEVDPDLVVAHGAAVQAALCEQRGGDLDIVVTDIASHSLGVETTKLIGGRKVDGFFSPIIHRNTTIPVSRSDVFSTLERNQTELLLKVFEGEHRRAQENNFIGELSVKGIPKGPAGQNVVVRFTYDLDGLLEVEATVAETGKAISKVLHRSGAEPTKRDVERFARRLPMLKRDPAEEPRNKDLLLRAQALWSEVAPEQRYALEAELDAFEAALHGGSAVEIKEQYDALQRVCEQNDEGERW